MHKDILSILKYVGTLVFISIVLLIPASLKAWNDSQIKWKKIETPHFSIHFHEGEEWSARETARIAEEIHGPITSFYGHDPGKVYITLYDRNDRSAGAAYFYLNRIDLDASDYEFHLRGTTDWLRNVLTHEFTHMVTIQVAMKLPRWMPAIYLQAINFENEKRPDVISGYPNFQGSIPIAGEVLPNWFAEGLAQYQCPLSRNDIWDTHRDMLLRMAVLGEKVLSIDEMGVFGKNSLESEMVYNQGYSLVRFIAEKYGEDKLCALMKAHSEWYRINFDGACKNVLGISGNELHAQWLNALWEKYNAVAQKIGSDAREGEKLAGKGFLNIFPSRGGDEGDVYYLSNSGGDYMDLDLVRQDRQGKTKLIEGGVHSRFSIADDGKTICYSKRTDKNEYGYELNDIYILDTGTGIEKRLTHSLRAVDPEFSPDNTTIAAIRACCGEENIVLVDIETGKCRQLTGSEKGRLYYGLSWGEKGILVSRFRESSRDIVLIDPETGQEEELVASIADERDPCWDSDGTGFFFASDRNGIFNIYYRDLDTGAEQMVTDLVGGAFSPFVRGEELVYSAYGPDGYEIRKLDDWAVDTRPVIESEEAMDMMSRRESFISRSRTADGIGNRYDYSDLDENIEAAEPFGVEYSKIYVFPRLMYYDKQPRIGLTLDQRDYLDRQSWYAAGSVNPELEFNLQFGFEVRQYKPTFSFDFYAARKYNKSREGGVGEIQYRYDLWDAFFRCRFELDKPTRSRKKTITLQYNHGEYGININAWDYPGIDQELGWNYYKANEVSILLDYWNIGRGVEYDINPRSGRRFHLEITRAWDKLFDGYFQYNFRPTYGNNDFGRYYMMYEEFIPLPFWSHSLSLFAKGGLIDEKAVDKFFNLYLGSRDGMRGYSYYSIGGKKNAMARITYRFPIWRGINKQVFSTYIGSLYGGIFAEAGKAWDEDKFDLDHNVKDLGIELRLKGFSFYNYPLAASFEAAYGLNRISYREPLIEGITFIKPIVEGEEWKFYGTVFFDF